MPINLGPYEAQYNVKPIGNGLTQANNVNAALVPALMRAHFSDYLNNANATVSAEYPRNLTASGSYTLGNKTIRLSPEGINTLAMKNGVGVGGYASTAEDNFNALRTMLHEGYHARLQPTLDSAKDPAAELKQLLGKSKYDSLMRDMRTAELPSVFGSKLPDSEVLAEFLASVIPAQQMKNKNISTKLTQGHLAEYDRLAQKFPAIKTIVQRWQTPETLK
jgi:hypothetical protein